jgi:phosphate transport system protein
MLNRLHKEIESLKKQILMLVAEVEDNVRASLNAVQNLNREEAMRVIEKDHHVDELEVQFEEECLKLLALYQPVANDLRFIIAVMKINNDLERVGDIAVNISERAVYLADREPISISFNFPLMAEKAQNMLRQSVTALLTLDVKMAYDVCASDDEIDDMNRQMYEFVEHTVKENPEIIMDLLQYLSISRYLERIGDHATNIAEDVIYLIEGSIVRHHVEDLKLSGL